MSNAGANYDVVIAGTLLFSFCCIFAYTLVRAEARKGILRVGAMLNLLAAVCWIFCAYFSGPEASDRAQSLLVTVRAIPFEVAIAYICYLLTQSIGKKYPKLEAVLRTGPWVLGVTMIYSLSVSVLWPMQGLNELGPTLPPEFLLLKLRDVVEIFYISLSGVTFATEALRPGVPSRTLRLQNTAFAFAAVCLFLLLLSAIIGSTMRVIPILETQKAFIVSMRLSLENGLLATGAIGYMTGLFLFHSGEEQDRIVKLFREWIRERHELEMAFDFYFGSRLEKTAVARRLEWSAQRLGLSHHDQETAKNVLKLAGLLMVEPASERIRNLYSTQAELLRASNFASRIFVKLEGSVHYDIKNDAVFRSLETVLRLTDQQVIEDVDEEWAHLAALVTVEAQFLPTETTTFLHTRNPYIKGRIHQIYEHAKLAV